jgi:hypothetical protein
MKTGNNYPVKTRNIKPVLTLEGLGGWRAAGRRRQPGAVGVICMRTG